MNHYIKKLCLSKSNDLLKFANSDLQIESFEIDCTSLNGFEENSNTWPCNLQDLFDKLKQINGPVLYWIEILNDIQGNNIISAFRNYYNDPSHRAIPAIKKYPNTDSKILYVGKVKQAFWVRIFQHLGFYKVKWTQGLQLYYWTSNLNLKLKVNFCRFNKDLEDLMPFFEVSFARNLKPILGKHK